MKIQSPQTEKTMIYMFLEDKKAYEKEKFNQDKESMFKYARGTRPRSFECGFSIVIQSESGRGFPLSSIIIFTIYKNKIFSVISKCDFYYFFC